MTLDYFYGAQADQFAFYRIPNGDCYLAGPGIIFALEDGDIVSLDVEDKKLITQVLEDGTAELTNGAEIRCAFGL